MHVHKVGCTFDEVYHVAFVNEEALFTTLAKTIEEARERPVVEVPAGGTAGDIFKRQRVEKMNLLALGANVTITLTKGHSFNTGCFSQLRVWVRNPFFWKDGTHVDNYGDRGIFEAYGQFEKMQALTQQFLAQHLRRFEDDLYVVWL